MSERIEERAEALAEREIYPCQSCLVDALLKLEGEDFTRDDNRSFASEWGIEAIENLYPDPSDWTMEDCREYLDDRGIDLEQFDGLDAWRDAVRENAEPQEPLEWWPVSHWLCAELREIGQPIIDNSYGWWWGRTCSGQAILADGTLQQIARNILSCKIQ